MKLARISHEGFGGRAEAPFRPPPRKRPSVVKNPGYRFVTHVC